MVVSKFTPSPSNKCAGVKAGAHPSESEDSVNNHKLSPSLCTISTAAHRAVVMKTYLSHIMRSGCSETVTWAHNFDLQSSPDPTPPPIPPTATCLAQWQGQHKRQHQQKLPSKDECVLREFESLALCKSVKRDKFSVQRCPFRFPSVVPVLDKVPLRVASG